MKNKHMQYQLFAQRAADLKSGSQQAWSYGWGGLRLEPVTDPFLRVADRDARLCFAKKFFSTVDF
jgi:hypothetical protein